MLFFPENSGENIDNYFDVNAFIKDRKCTPDKEDEKEDRKFTLNHFANILKHHELTTLITEPLLKIKPSNDDEQEDLIALTKAIYEMNTFQLINYDDYFKKFTGCLEKNNPFLKKYAVLKGAIESFKKNIEKNKTLIDLLNDLKKIIENPLPSGASSDPELRKRILFLFKNVLFEFDCGLYTDEYKKVCKAMHQYLLNLEKNIKNNKKMLLPTPFKGLTKFNEIIKVLYLQNSNKVKAKKSLISEEKVLLLPEDSKELLLKSPKKLQQEVVASNSATIVLIPEKVMPPEKKSLWATLKNNYNNLPPLAKALIKGVLAGSIVVSIFFGIGGVLTVAGLIGWGAYMAITSSTIGVSVLTGSSTAASVGVGVYEYKTTTNYLNSKLGPNIHLDKNNENLTQAPSTNQLPTIGPSPARNPEGSLSVYKM